MKETRMNRPMNRRDMLVGAGLALVATASSRALADKPKPAPVGGSSGLTAAAAHCEQAAQACLRHCLQMLSAGDTSMAGCAKAVADLIPAVHALAAISAGSSRHVGPLAKVVGEIAKDCKAECDKHATMPPCKACGDSCAALLAEIGKL
jgi:Cys-rich four helix bundle protein (predicted Tat secretion target)